MPNDPYGWTIFCDDIRQEVGGKYSCMGIYKGNLMTPSFPVTLPKFALSMYYRMFLDDTRLDNIELNIFMPGVPDKPAAQGVIDLARVVQEMDPATQPGDVFRELTAQMILAPITFNEPGRLEVRAVGGAGLIKMGSLRIEQAKR